MKDLSQNESAPAAPAPPWVKQMKLGVAHAQKGDMKRAAERFNAVLKSDPKNPDALHFLGVIMHQRAKSEQGIKLIRRSLAIEPTNANAHNNLGNIFKETGDNVEAAASYREALKHDPLNASTLSNLGVMLRNEGKFDEAIDALKQAIAIDTELPEAHHNLGKTYAAAGRLKDASDAFREELLLHGDFVDPVAVSKIFVARGNKAEAESILTGYLERNPNHAGAKFQLAAVRGDAIDIVDEGHVTEVFDRFAASFDATLRNLDYRAPHLVAEALSNRLGEPKGDKIILDLGCGTGLCGPLIEDYKKKLIGMDLSSEMMVRAKRLGCYDVLAKAELQKFMEDQSANCIDVATCVDTLVYIGALERTFAGAKHVLRKGGLFIATVESLPDDAPQDHIVDATGRFKHARRYLERLAAENNLTVLGITDAVMRNENDKPVHGFVVELQQPL